MNWITNSVLPKIKAWVQSDDVPDNLWIKCSACSQMIFHREYEQAFNCCATCGHHSPLPPEHRFAMLFDNGKYDVISLSPVEDDPLKFRDNKKYTDRLKAARKITNQNDAVLIAKGKVKDIEVVVGAQDFRFIGGSFGAASGEAFIAGIQHSIENNCPFIFYSCSGGQRMMESSIALMQMSRTALAVNELKKKKIPDFPIALGNPRNAVSNAVSKILPFFPISIPRPQIKGTNETQKETEIAIPRTSA